MISKIIRFRTFLLNYFLKELPLAFFLSFFFIHQREKLYSLVYVYMHQYISVQLW